MREVFNITHIFKEFAKFFIGLEMHAVAWAVSSRQHFSAEDFRTVIKPSVELTQVILLKKTDPRSFAETFHSLQRSPKTHVSVITLTLILKLA